MATDNKQKQVGNAMDSLLGGLTDKIGKKPKPKSTDADNTAEIQKLEQTVADLQEEMRENLVRGFHIADKGLYIADWVDEETWKQFGILMGVVRVSWEWVIADWLAFGNHKYGDKAYQTAAELFGKSPRTWEDYAYIARNVQFSERSENLPPLVHKPVATFNDEPELQRELIQLAETHKLSKELFEAIIPLYLEDRPYSHLLPNKITPIERANLKEDKHRASILKRAKGKAKKQWLSYARKQAEEWAKVAGEIEDKDD